MLQPKNLICFCFALVFLLSGLGTQAQVRYKVSINQAWKFKRADVSGAEKTEANDSDWQVLNLPHTWNTQDAMDEDRGYYRGVGWYRKTMSVSPDLKGKRIFLYFEGANQEAEVFVNGKSVGKHIGGYTAFNFEVTAVVNFDKPNTIAVKVDNTNIPDIPPLSADFTMWGGLYRDVYLLATNPVHMDVLDHASPGVFIETPTVSDDEATVVVKGTVVNQSAKALKTQVVSRITDATGSLVAELRSTLQIKPNTATQFTQTGISITKPNLWSPDSPYLYQVTTSIYEGKNKIADEVVNPLGFRWFSFDGGKGFFLNGKPLKLQGVCRHQDRAGMGNALTDDLHRYDMQLIKAMGANFIRIAHYPQDPAILEACDRLGILAWEEIPIVNEITINEPFFDNSKNMMTDLIRQHRNHPSIIIWGYMNEIFLGFRKPKTEEEKKANIAKTVELAKLIDSYTRQEDPARYTAMALHNSGMYNESGIADVPQVIGWNLYHGWYHDNFPDFGKMLDEEHRKYPNRPLIISEYGAGSDTRLHSLEPERYDFTAEYARAYHESYHKQIMERPYVAGYSLWNMVDFGSEGRKESMPRVNNKGLLTHDRKPKDIYYYYKAALRTEPVLYIASREWANRKGQEGNITATQPVEVYTNQTEVELFQNGKSLGKKKAEQYKASWDVTFENGKNHFQAVSDAVKDYFDIDFTLLPADLTLLNPMDEIAVNAGGNVQFVDNKTGFVWQSDQPYTKGSWGYIGGSAYRATRSRIGTTLEMLGAIDGPLYQTCRDSVQAYRFDVADGSYEIELLFVEPDAKKAEKILYDINQSNAADDKNQIADERIFNVLVNGQKVLDNLNLGQQYGANRAVNYKFISTVVAGQGLEIRFKAIKGSPIISAIRVRKMI